MHSEIEKADEDLNFLVTVAGGNFVIDGSTKPALTLYKGFTYTFDVSDSSNATHVLAFATQAEEQIHRNIQQMLRLQERQDKLVQK